MGKFLIIITLSFNNKIHIDIVNPFNLYKILDWVFHTDKCTAKHFFFNYSATVIIHHL